MDKGKLGLIAILYRVKRGQTEGLLQIAVDTCHVPSLDLFDHDDDLFWPSPRVLHRCWWQGCNHGRASQDSEETGRPPLHRSKAKAISSTDVYRGSRRGLMIRSKNLTSSAPSTRMKGRLTGQSPSRFCWYWSPGSIPSSMKVLTSCSLPAS